MEKKDLFWLDEVKKKIHDKICEKIIDLDLESLQNFCMKSAKTLSDCSCAIFHQSNVYPRKELIESINMISNITKENPEGAIVQERSSYLKQSLNLIYSETENLKYTTGKRRIELNEFIELVTLECSIIIIFELRRSLTSGLASSIVFQTTPLDIYSKDLEQSSILIENMLGISEELYNESSDRIMRKFKSEHGFDDKSLIDFFEVFKRADDTLLKSKQEMETLIKKQLKLNQNQLQFFMKVMTFNSHKVDKESLIKNVNCSIFSTPFVITATENVIVNKSNLYESSMYLRRRIINEDIEDKGTHPLVKELINEKYLPIIQKKLTNAKINSTINKNLEKDEVLKKLLYNQKGFPHELDLYYVEKNVLKIFDLKNYRVPLSTNDVVRIKKSINKEVMRLFKLDKFISKNKETIKNRLHLKFNTIEYGILLTKDYYLESNYRGIQVISVSDYLKNLGNSL